MDRNKVFGWLLIIAGGWWLLSGIFTNDMGGIVGLGVTPDLPISFGRYPFRFVLGILINGAILVVGIRKVGEMEY